jgi:hypothetical protein
MGSILRHGQGSAGGASVDGFDWDKALADAQPITPPASKAPPLFRNRRREYPVFPSPMMVFSFPQHPNDLISPHSAFNPQPPASLISPGRSPSHGPYGDTPHKCRFSSSHASGGGRHDNIDK